MIKFIKNLFSSETKKGEWGNQKINLLEEESKYKPRLKKILGKWYVTNMEEGCYTRPNSKVRNKFWSAYYWTRDKNERTTRVNAAMDR